MPDPAQPTQPTGKRLLKPAAAVSLILAAIYANEDGYTNDPHDAGGETNWGVTKAVARAAGYAGPMRAFPQHCSPNAPVCADLIYTHQYIDRSGYTTFLTIEPAIGAKLADTAVNMGPAKANCFWRSIVRRQVLECAKPAVMAGFGKPLTDADVIPYISMQVHVGKVAACEATLQNLATLQRSEYERLIRARPANVKYRNGWLARAAKLHPGPQPIPCGVAG